MSALTETSTGASPSPGATAPAALAVAVLGLGQDAAAYEMFDVVSLDVAGARLAGPLLLEIGEELTLRLSRASTRSTGSMSISTTSILFPICRLRIWPP